MIIKKQKKIIRDNNQDKKTSPKEEVLEVFKVQEQSLGPFMQDRQERRRGDRRRGYRRTDDRNLISRAHQEANAIKERAAKEGFEYGLTQAKEELKKLEISIAEFLQAKEKAMEMAASDISFIAVKVAEKIIKTEVACDEQIILNIISEVLKTLSKDETSIVIKTNPLDTKLVEKNLPKLFPYGSKNTKIFVVDDENVDWGSCIIETSNGIVDAKFSTQLQIVEKTFEAEI